MENIQVQHPLQERKIDSNQVSFLRQLLIYEIGLKLFLNNSWWEEIVLVTAAVKHGGKYSSPLTEPDVCWQLQQLQQESTTAWLEARRFGGIAISISI